MSPVTSEEAAIENVPSPSSPDSAATDEILSLFSSLKLQPDSQALLEQLLGGNNSNNATNSSITLLTRELQNAFLESSKSCLTFACPIVAHICATISTFVNSEDRNSLNSRLNFELSAAVLELIPNIVVATFLYGSTSHSLLETASTNFSSLHPNLSHTVASMSVPPSPTTTNGSFPVPPSSSPAVSLRHTFTATPAATTSSTATGTHSSSSGVGASPDYLLQYVLHLFSNGALSAAAVSMQQSTSGVRASAGSLSASTLRPGSAGGNVGRAGSPNPQSTAPTPAVHHFASLVAPSVYHNPVLFGASVISDNAQTEHHQRERKVRIYPPRSLPPVASILSNFNGELTGGQSGGIPPGMVTPLAVAALAEFNRHHAAQLSCTDDVKGIIRCCDAALRLLAMPVSSPSLQAVSSSVVLQFIYFVSIVSGGGVYESNDLGSATAAYSESQIARPPSRSCRKSSTATSPKPPKPKGSVAFDLRDDDTVDYSSEEDISEEEHICRVKLLQLLHAARTLAELRLWPDVLAVVKAVKNTTGLAIDLGEGDAAMELPLPQPTSARAITNASFRARKLPDDIEATVDQKESSSQKRNAFTQQHQNTFASIDVANVPPEAQQHGTSGKRSGHHHHHGTSAAGQFTSHWRAGKHSAAIASLQAAFRLPERLRSRRRSFGHESGTSANSSGTLQGQNAPTPPQASQRAPNIVPSLAAAPSFSFVDRDSTANNTPSGPRLEMRILDNISSNVVEGVEETCLDNSDLPMIDSTDNRGASSGSTNITPRSRTNSLGVHFGTNKGGRS